MRAIALVLALVVLAPLAVAHVQNARPSLQAIQVNRLVTLQPQGLVIVGHLVNPVDPLRHAIEHELDPAEGRFRVEYRLDQSDASSAFFAEWGLTRIIEYRDLNVDGRYQPSTDTAVKAWRLEHYSWRPGGVRDVKVADVDATSAIWEGNLSGGPDIRIEAVIAGKEFTDEGALVRPNDVALYIDVTDLPARATGSLYAVDGHVRAASASRSAIYRVGEFTTAAVVDAPLRRAMLVWGGEALLDGREQAVVGTLGEPHVDGDTQTRTFALSLPPMERSMHFVLVSGVDYGAESRRGPLEWGFVVVACGVAALLLRRRA